MRRKPIEPIVFIILDEDRRLFSLTGPVVDDTEWTSRVIRQRNSGRNVKLCEAPKGLTRDELMAHTREWSGYIYTDDDIA